MSHSLPTTDIPLGTECETGVVGVRPARQRWWWWVVGAGLLMLGSGLLFYRANQNHIRRMELAAEQIEIGSDWRSVWTANQELWGWPIFSGHAVGSTTDEFYYCGPLDTVKDQIGTSIPNTSFGTRWFNWFYQPRRFPVIISVSQNGQGKVVEVCVNGVSRRTNAPRTNSNSGSK